MPVTHLQIAAAKPTERDHSLGDGDSLFLIVRTSGAKLWRISYRYLGRQKTLHLGDWPEIGIASARRLRDVARKQLSQGLDRAAEKRLASDGYTGHGITVFALKLSPHLFVRPGELRAAKWAEFDVDAAI